MNGRGRECGVFFGTAAGFVARLLLSAAFFLVLTPVGLAVRLVGWDPLWRRKGRRHSGWVPYPKRFHDVKHYERMY